MSEVPEVVRVLSIQSTVVHGYVGNKAAVFPMQLHGFDVDPLNTVQLSNHTGYKHFSGQRMTGDDCNELLKGLYANQLFQGYKYVISGYMGSVSFLGVIVEAIQKLIQADPSIVYGKVLPVDLNDVETLLVSVVCDPVMGDGGKLYVPNEFVSVYREKFLPLATVLLPNQTELELLTESKVQTVDDVVSACSKLHKQGPRIVIVTSFSVQEQPQDEILVLTSELTSEHQLCFMFKVKKFPGYYSGTGDLFASLFLSWYHKTQSVEKSVQNTYVHHLHSFH
jgi:pyridoxine kinase